MATKFLCWMHFFVDIWLGYYQLRLLNRSISWILKMALNMEIERWYLLLYDKMLQKFSFVYRRMMSNAVESTCYRFQGHTQESEETLYLAHRNF